ncbi:MAG TPA: ATP-binding protein [Pseudomonadales bacterium]
MTTLLTLEDIAAVRETWNIECKLAQGRDGHGALPEDIWETYSAFANTAGGDIFLGLRELGPGKYELAGIRDAEQVVAEFMKGVNDPKVVSVNVLCVDSVAIMHIEGKAIVHINVPRASIYLRPVYVGSNPLHGSFIRTGSSDIRLFPERVKRMQARVRGEMLGKA